MKKAKPEYIISFVFTAVMLFFMCTIIFRFVGSKFFNIQFENNNASETDIGESTEAGINWEEKYPFDKSLSFNYESQADNKTQTVNEIGFSDKIKALESRIDYYSSNLLFGRMKFVEANALFNKKIGMKIISGKDAVVAMRNGFLTFEAHEVNTDYPAQSLKWFDGVLREKGINLLYVQYPSKENKADNKLPMGIVDYNNINADSLMERLKLNGVDCIDFRALLTDETDNWYNSFFITDHHWRPETGVWAAGKLAEILNRKYDYGIDEGIGELDNYDIKVYEKFSLGSQGKITTLKFTDPEDISLIVPKNKMMNFTVNYHAEYGGTGGYDEVLLNKSVFDKVDYYNTSAYSAYLFGNNAVTSIKNNSVHNGKRLLMLSDSFCKCVVPCLAQGIEYIDVIDRRYFSGSIQSYIDEFKPDTVVVAYNPTLISSDTGHSGPYNFE